MTATAKPEWITSDYGASYDDLVASWGYDLLDSQMCGSYQGDLLYLLRDGERYGFLTVGYGSCSGCDALEDAQPFPDTGDWTPVVELAASLRDDIRWHQSAHDLADYLTSDMADGGNSWIYHDDDVKQTVTRFVNALTQGPAQTTETGDPE